MWAKVGSGIVLAALQVAIYFTSGLYALLASVCICACIAVMKNARDACPSGTRNLCMYSATFAALIVLTAWTVYSLRIGKTSGAGFLIVLSMGFTLMLMGHRFLFFEDAEEPTQDSADAADGKGV